MIPHTTMKLLTVFEVLKVEYLPEKTEPEKIEAENFKYYYIAVLQGQLLQLFVYHDSEHKNVVVGDEMKPKKVSSKHRRPICEKLEHGGSELGGLRYYQDRVENKTEKHKNVVAGDEMKLKKVSSKHRRPICENLEHGGCELGLFQRPDLRLEANNMITNRGGAECLRHNADGEMEYDLVKVGKISGMQYPYTTPPPGDCPSQDPLRANTTPPPPGDCPSQDLLRAKGFSLLKTQKMPK
ncbi:hypothetical protein POM88_042422 [Heracleum sosnowskyi]|uniref:Uncharacterized protein n=1 Tax=Heracleum sosnowskyi TaxID=360622 RepID=A0AAD8HGS0_9APIA|nr:hypothetical protein POM88_042422 [Heracleum sosnowskyi]